MNIILNLKQLQETMDLAYRFVSKHSTLPVLENIYIKANIDSVIIRATDMEKYIEIEMPAKVESEGTTTINAKMFLDIIKMVEETEIKLILNESNEILSIKAGKDDFKIKGISSSEYVAVPEFGGFNVIKIDSNHFSKGVEKVEFAVTEKNFSPVLTGVLMRLRKEEKGNKLIFVGTDSFRLAEYKIDFNGDFTDTEIIVPKINMGDIKKVADYYIANGGEEIEVNISENLVSFVFNLKNVKIMTTSLLIQGTFPSYENESIIPTQFNLKTTINKIDLEKAIKKIGILTRDINNYIYMTISNNAIEIKSGETDKGEGNTFLSIITDGDNIEYGINGKYVLDFIRVSETDEIHMNVLNPERPIVFKERDDNNYTYIVRTLVK